MGYFQWILASLFVFCGPSLNADQGLPAVERAARENKHLFIFFYKDQNERTLRTQKVFDQAIQKLSDSVLFVKVKSNDPAEKGIIDKFNLKRSPMPFILVLAPSGAVTGGFPSTVNEQQLLGSFVSPKMGSCLKALQDKKLVFLSLQNERTSGNEAALKGIYDFKADPRFGGAVEIIIINPADPQEQKFLSQLAINTTSNQASTVFIAPPAETIGQYAGATSKDRFVTDLQNAVSCCCGPGGCCPGGCCPGGKCK